MQLGRVEFGGGAAGVWGGRSDVEFAGGGEELASILGYIC
jgi:hypothetical protein